MSKELSEKIKDLTALLTGLAALWATVKELLPVLGEPDKLKKNWPWLILLVVVLLIVLLWRRDRLMRWLAPRSTVLKREAFQIGRKHLKGREEDIKNLLRLLSDWPLVFLVGESGAGKSSLLERGVLPKLREEDPSRLAIFVSTWGPDWVEGPREAVALALNPLLNEDLRKRLGLEGPVSSTEALKVLGRLREKAGVLPVLFFDQFDDYQVRHRTKFLSGPNRTVLGAKELTRKNAFWKEIAGLLRTWSIRCLFVTRTDAKVGLESVELLPEEERRTYLLDPLDKKSAADLLDEITKDGAVDRPDRGFDRLKERLLGDLSIEGWVLPIQMQVAFSGLVDLRALTSGEYGQQGGLRGLEALYLESRIAAAVRAVGWRATDVRTVLLGMVDPVAQKTIQRTETELLELLPEGGREATKLRELLGKLEADEVVRQRLEPGQDESSWQLDHDYLSRGLLELNRRARRWPIRLDDSLRVHANVTGVIGWWRTLLPPYLQLRLFWEYLCGRLRYGTAVGFARISTLRLIANVWSLLLVSGLYGWHEWRVQQDATKLLEALSPGSGLYGGYRIASPVELQALWELRGESRSVRRAFLRLAFSSARDFSRLAGKQEEILQATVGFDEADRRYMVDLITSGKCVSLAKIENKGVDAFAFNACLSFMERLGVPLRARADLLKAVARYVTSYSDLIDLQESSLALSDIKMQEEISEVLSRSYLRLLRHELNLPGYWGVSLGYAHDHLKSYCLRLSEGDGVEAVELVLGLMEKVEGYKNSGIVVHLSCNVEFLSEAQWIKVLSIPKRIVESSAPNDFGAFLALNDLGPVCARLPAEDAQEVRAWMAGAVIKRAEFTVDAPFWGHERFGECTGSPGVAEIWKAYVVLLERASLVESSLLEHNVGSNFKRLAEELAPEEALEIWYFMLDKIAISGQPMLQDLYLGALQEVGARLRGGQFPLAMRAALPLIRSSREDAAMARIAVILASFGEEVPRNLSVEIGNIVVENMNRNPIESLRYVWLSQDRLPESLVRDALAESFRLIRVRDGQSEFRASRLLEIVALLAAYFSSEDGVFVSDLILSGDYRGFRGVEMLESIVSSSSPGVQAAVSDLMVNNLAKADSCRKLLPIMALEGRNNWPPGVKDKVLERFLSVCSREPFSGCQMVSRLVDDPFDSVVFEVIKWPTCSRTERDELINVLDDFLPNKSFRVVSSRGESRADLWAFAAWAKGAGIDLESPPEKPEPL